MPTIKNANTGEVLFEFQTLNVLDEFLPVVYFDKAKFKRPSTFKVVTDPVRLMLDEVYNIEPRSYPVLHVTTGLDYKTKPKGKREIKFPFAIKQGASGTLDKAGNIKAKIVPPTPGVTVDVKKSGVFKYGDEFTIIVNVAGNQERSFSVDFLASDDEDFNEGEMADLLCGRVKVTILGSSKVSLKLLENIVNLEIVTGPYSAPHHSTWDPDEIALSQKQANLYQNCKGVCYATAESRANKAYVDLFGRNVVNLTPSEHNIDHRIAATLKTKDPYMGYGAGGAFAYHKLGSTVDDSAVWSGGLKAGALLQRWNKRGSADLFSAGGHSVIFRAYRYSDAGEIIGIEITDNNGGINGGVFVDRDDDNPWLKTVHQKSMTLLGVNLHDAE